MLELSTQQMVALPTAALARLRDGVARDGGDAAPMQDAGYVAGAALYDAFAASLAARARPTPDVLDLDSAQREASDFLEAAGWGAVRFERLGAALAVDGERWAEAEPGAGLDHPGCYFGTALLSGFFGRLADAPLAALEVECRSAGAPRCRFLLGAPDALARAHSALAGGADYAAVLGG